MTISSPLGAIPSITSDGARKLSTGCETLYTIDA
jgi:hypothetical protein